tara:strand:- start:42 stop:926 length:885 start_codon:yes stop_codon:yes gene_type:complete
VASIYDIYSPEELETMGLLSQVVANQPKFFDVTQEVSKMGDMVPIAAGSADPEALTKTGFGGNKVFVGVGDKASDVASMYAKEGILRGTPFGTPTSEPFKGLVSKGNIEFGRNMFGHLEGKVSPNVANTAFNLPNSGIMQNLTDPRFSKFLGRFLPGANIGLGYASALNRFNQGQYLRALAAGASMIPGPIGYLGLGAETAMDVGEALINKELQKKQEQVRADNAAKAQESRNQSRDDYTGGGGTVVIGTGGGQTKTVSPRSREAMYAAPTRTSEPPPFSRFNNGGIVGLFRRF